MSAQSLLNEISSHIKKQGGRVSSWYAGITSDVETRLFGAHKVSRENWFIHRKAASGNQARAIKKALLNWGCDGRAGGGDEDAVIVYAYLKSRTTDP